jgi:hypothetical protein
MIRAGDFDICILGSSMRNIKYNNGIHIWIRDLNCDNERLMVLLSYVILSHPAWKNASVSLFTLSPRDRMEETRENIARFVLEGRLPVSKNNITVIEKNPDVNFRILVAQYSAEAALTIMGFYDDRLKNEGVKYFEGFDEIGDVLFVNAHDMPEIN